MDKQFMRTQLKNVEKWVSQQPGATRRFRRRLGKSPSELKKMISQLTLSPEEGRRSRSNSARMRGLLEKFEQTLLRESRSASRKRKDKYRSRRRKTSSSWFERELAKAEGSIAKRSPPKTARKTSESRKTRKSRKPKSPSPKYGREYKPATVRTQRGEDTILVKPGTSAADIQKLVDAGWIEVVTLRNGTIFKNPKLEREMETDEVRVQRSTTQRRQRRAADGPGGVRIFKNAIRDLQAALDKGGVDEMLELQEMMEKL